LNLEQDSFEQQRVWYWKARSGNLDWPVLSILTHRLMELHLPWRLQRFG
jgi:hypothetical protein